MKVEKELIALIDQWIGEHKTQLIDETCELVNIESISDKNADIKPFGQGCRDVLDKFFEIGARHGFTARNHDYYVGELYLPENADKPRRIGILSHLDVVPVGDGWEYPPFQATVKDGVIIGRGSQDNKGPAMATLYTAMCIRDLGLKLNHDVCSLVGLDEESGMNDVEYYVKNCDIPYFILVSDSGFPVSYGEKGSMGGWFVSDNLLSDQIVSFAAGETIGQVPEKASVNLRYSDGLAQKLKLIPEDKNVDWRRDGDTIQITALGVGGHISFAIDKINAVKVAAQYLLKNDLLENAVDREIFSFAATVADGNDGANLGIAVSDAESGSLVFGCGMALLQDGKLRISFRSRCPASADVPKLLEFITDLARKNHFSIDEPRATKSIVYRDKNDPVIQILNQTLCDITGHKWEPQIFGAGNHARKLPNGVGYGPGGTKDFVPPFLALPPGHGGAHQPDEAQSIDMLCMALKAYIIGVISIDDLDLSVGVLPH